MNTITVKTVYSECNDSIALVMAKAEAAMICQALYHLKMAHQKRQCGHFDCPPRVEEIAKLLSKAINHENQRTT